MTNRKVCELTQERAEASQERETEKKGKDSLGCLLRLWQQKGSHLSVKWMEGNNSEFEQTRFRVWSRGF